MRGFAKALSLGAMLVCAAACDRHVAEDSVGKSFPAKGHVALEVHNIAGATCITRGDDDRTVVLARVRGFGFEQKDADKALAHGLDALHITQDGPKITVDREECEGEVEVDFKIQVPRDTEIDASTSSGSLCATDVVGPVTVDTVSGDVELAKIGGAVKVSGISSDVAIDGAGGVEVDTASGNVTADHVTGDLRASTVSGDVNLGEIGRIARSTTTSGGITVDSTIASDALWTFETVSGDVTVLAPRAAAARFELRTVSGDLVADEARSASRHGADDAVQLGDDPTALVSVHTTSGSLHVLSK